MARKEDEGAWERGFAALSKFKARTGHYLVPRSYKLRGFKLGQWVAVQRYKEDTLSPERKKRLNAIGFVWDAHEAAWEKVFVELTKFKAREGHCRVPDAFVTGTCKLGLWVAIQRSKKDALPPERKKRLNAIGFMWDPHEHAWEQGFEELTKFVARKGHFRVPEENSKLERWVRDQRFRADTLSSERKKRLNAIGFIWDPHEHAWEQGFAALTKFKAREGHCVVPRFHMLGGYKLGQWVHEQRHRGTVSPRHKKRLNAIGFVWDPHEYAWERGYTALTKFKARMGHCRVPQFFATRTYKLGQWVMDQRVRADTLSPERKKRLNAIGFIWNENECAWEKGFAALRKFKARKGHCRVPSSHIEEKYKLGQWVQNQRAKVSAKRRRRLNKIGFVWRMR